MANFELIGIPLLTSLFFLLMALAYFRWWNRTMKAVQKKAVRGKAGARLFGISLVVMGLYSLFIGLFFFLSN